MKELLMSPTGLLSLFTIIFVVVMGGYLFRFALKNMDEDARNAGRDS